MDDLLSVERLLVERQNGRIGKDVVVEAGSERAGKADIVDLDRCRPGGEDPGARIRRIAAAVDRNVDLQVVQERGNLAVTFPSHIVKLIECANQPGADFAVIVRAERKAQDLESRPVMNLDEFGGQIRRRMLVEAAGNIRNPDLPVAPDSACPKLRWADRDLLTDEPLGACQLQCGIAAVAEEGEGIEHNARWQRVQAIRATALPFAASRMSLWRCAPALRTRGHGRDRLTAPRRNLPAPPRRDGAASAHRRAS